MKPLIPPAHYSNNEYFEQEKIVLGQQLWNFAGFATDLDNHNEGTKILGGRIASFP